MRCLSYLISKVSLNYVKTESCVILRITDNINYFMEVLHNMIKNQEIVLQGILMDSLLLKQKQNHVQFFKKVNWVLNRKNGGHF